MARSSTWTPDEQVQWVRQKLPDHVRENLESILGGPQGLDAMLLAASRPAARLNPLKAPGDETLRRLHALGIRTHPVSWSDTTVFLEDPQKRPLGHLFEHQAGHLFLHDAASTLPVQALDPRPGERVLDLCAAPGGKTTHILARMHDEGLVVANEPKPQRVNHLVSTLDRTGALSCIVTQRDGRHARWPVPFDRVLVDAPCSNLGGIHHTPGPAIKLYADTIPRHVRLQRRLLLAAAHATRPGGTIVYATCTLDPRENEENAAWFARQDGIALEPHGLPLRGHGAPDGASPAAREAGEATLRIHPGDPGTDAFFIARFTRLDAPAPPIPDPGPRTGDPRRDQAPPEPAGREAIHRLVEHTALDPAPFEDVTAVTTPTRLYGTRIPPHLLEPFLPLRPARIGQLLANRETPGPRLRFDAATRFGTHSQETLELDEPDARAWLAGASVTAPSGTPRHEHRIVNANGQPIGATRAYGERLPSFVPKIRRVPEDPSFHGWAATP